MNRLIRLVMCVFVFVCTSAFAQTVAVLTPYLASATTKIMVDSLAGSLEE